MSAGAYATLESSEEGRHFLEVVAKCSDTELAQSLIDAAAKLLNATVGGKANGPGQASVEISSALLSLKELSFINPRGKFDLTFSRDALAITNSKTKLVVPTSLVTNVVVLDQIPQDTRKRCLLFVVLDRNGPAVLNGKQRLDAVIIQTLESDTTTTKAASGEVLEGPMAAVLCQAVGMCIPNFTNFLAPDPELFKTSKGDIAVPAVVKVSPGLLFPLPGAVLFAERPALFVSHSDILAVEYRRPQSATFDLVLHTRAGGGEGSSRSESIQEVEFSQISRGELGRLQSYFAASKVKAYDPSAPPQLKLGGAAGGSAGANDADEEKDEDEDEEDEDFDPSELERREQGKSRGRPAKRPRVDPGGAGPSGSHGGGLAQMAAAQVQELGGGEDEEDEDEDEDEDDEESDEGEEEEDELEDLTDEEDLAADAVRQRVRHGSGAGGSGGGSGSKRSGRGGAAAMEESEEDLDEDDEE